MRGICNKFKKAGNEGQQKHNKFKEQTEPPLSLSKPKQRSTGK